MCSGIQVWDSRWVAHLSELRVSSHKVPVMKRNYLNWTINPITVSLMVEKMKHQLPPTSSTCIICEFHKELTWKSFRSDLGTVDHRVGLERPWCKSQGQHLDSPVLKWHQSHFSDKPAWKVSFQSPWGFMTGTMTQSFHFLYCVFSTLFSSLPPTLISF